MPEKLRPLNCDSIESINLSCQKGLFSFSTVGGQLPYYTNQSLDCQNRR